MFDPSKMDPKVLMELSQLIQQLPPGQLNQMQTLMHNMMAGFDVSREMAEFEKNLPPGFREKLAILMASNPSMQSAFASAQQEFVSRNASGSVSSAASAPAATGDSTASAEMNIREARLTILRGVAQGNLSPEEAEKLLFSES